MCGIFGLKPSRARTIDVPPTGPISLSVRNLVTLSVRDSATALYLCQAASSLPRLPHMTSHTGRAYRIALLEGSLHGAAAHPEVAAAITRTALLCEQLGHTVEEVERPFDGEAFWDAFLLVWASGASTLARMVRADAASRGSGAGGQLEPFTLGLADWFDSQPPGRFESALQTLAGVSARSAEFHSRYDLSLSPVLCTLPPKIGHLAPTLPFELVMQRLVGQGLLTPVANASGEPAMSVPSGYSAGGLPIGSHFQAAVGREDRLLEMAFQLEQAAPWVNDLPPLLQR